MSNVLLQNHVPFLLCILSMSFSYEANGASPSSSVTLTALDNERAVMLHGGSASVIRLKDGIATPIGDALVGSADSVTGE